VTIPAVDDTDPLALETALSQVGEEAESRGRALVAFVKARVWVLSDRDPGPDPETLKAAQLSLVSDGPNQKQAMLAVFSSPERAGRFLADHGGAPHVIPVEGPFAVLAVPAGAGIIINPNQAPSFRIGPEAVDYLKEEMAHARDRYATSPPSPP
jgi:hypothetical protein